MGAAVAVGAVTIGTADGGATVATGSAVATGAVGTSGLLRSVMKTTEMLARTATTATLNAAITRPRPLLEAPGVSRASCIAGCGLIGGRAGCA